MSENTNQSESGSFVCGSCERVYLSYVAYQQHVIPCGEYYSNFMCDWCDKTFGTLKDRKIHEQTYHSKTRKFPCSYCPYRAPSEKGMQRHEYKEHGKLANQCDFCGKTYMSNDDGRKQHIISCEAQPSRLTCNLCDKKFKCLSDRKYHEDTYHNPDRKFSCPYCSYRALTEPGLKQHKGKCHKGSGGERKRSAARSETTSTANRVDQLVSFRCEFCGEVCPSIDAYEVHVTLCEDDNSSVICSTCGKKFDTSDQKKLHEESFHSKNGEFACTHCEYRAFTEVELNHHETKEHRKSSGRKRSGFESEQRPPVDRNGVAEGRKPRVDKADHQSTDEAYDTICLSSDDDNDESLVVNARTSVEILCPLCEQPQPSATALGHHVLKQHMG